MPSHPPIQVARADIGRRFDQLLLLLVVLAIAVAWLSEPGQPWRFVGLAALLGLSWFIPRFLNGNRRAGACNPASLCAQSKVQYQQPVALQTDEAGRLLVCWTDGAPWQEAREVRTIWLGPLLHLAVATEAALAPSAQTAAAGAAAAAVVPPVQIASTEFMPHPLGSGSTPASAGALDPSLQRGSCMLWLPHLPDAEAATLRRWLVWRRRGGHA